MTIVRIAYHPIDTGDMALSMAPRVPDEDRLPAILVSFVYFKQWQRNRARFHFRDWVMDSGAFSAHHSGTTIDIDEYIDVCKALLETDDQLSEVYALDVIGDYKASIDNCVHMHERGVPAIPTFHAGSPVDALKTIARDFPKIALGGAVGFKQKRAWAEKCFAHVWPKAIHGFGFGSKRDILHLPWHSVDATNWEIGPMKFGTWRAFGGKVPGLRKRLNVRAEVEYYLKVEREAKAKWRRELARVNYDPADFSLRLVYGGNTRMNHSLPPKEEA